MGDGSSSRRSGTPIRPFGLIYSCSNNVINIKSQRDVVVANHIPESVLFLLLGFVIRAAGIVGYGNGEAGDRSLVPTLYLLIIIFLVIMVIMDLDRHQQGLARVSQQSMIELQEFIKSL